MKDKILTIFFLMIFSVISLIIVGFWFKEHAIIFLGDEPFVYNATAYLFRRSFSWLELNCGMLSTSVPAYYISLWYYAWSVLGFPPWLIQALMFYILLFLQFYATFILNIYILKSSLAIRNRSIFFVYIPAFLGSLFYVFNVCQMTLIWTDLKGLAFSAAFYPLFLYCIFNVIIGKEPRHNLGYVFLAAISLFISLWGSPKIWPSVIVYTLGLIAWCTVYFNVNIHILFKRIMSKYIAILILLVVLMSIPIFLTVYLSLTSTASSYTLPSNLKLYVNILKVRSRNTTLLSTFHIWGMNTLNEPVGYREKIFGEVISLLKPPYRSLLFIPLMLALIPMFSRLQKRLIILYILLAYTITMISIIHIPILANLYLHLYEKIRFLTLYNEPWSNYGLFYILLLSILIPQSFTVLVDARRSKLSGAILLLMLFLSVLYLVPVGYLFTTGKFIPQEPPFNSKVKIPNYVREGIRYIEQNSNQYHRIVFLPLGLKSDSDWKYNFYGNDIFVWMTKLDAIGTGYGYNIPITVLRYCQSRYSVANIVNKYLVLPEGDIYGYKLTSKLFIPSSTYPFKCIGAYKFLIIKEGTYAIKFLGKPVGHVDYILYYPNGTKISRYVFARSTVYSFKIKINNNEIPAVIIPRVWKNSNATEVIVKYLNYQSRGEVVNLENLCLNVFRILGIKWIVIRNDTLWIDKLMGQKPDIKFIIDLLRPITTSFKVLNKWRIIRINNTFPVVYIAKHIIPVTSQEINDFVKGIIKISLNESNAVLVDKNIVKECCKVLSRKPSETYKIYYLVKKCNPTHYVVYVNASSNKGFLLVLLQNYDPYWKAIIVKNGSETEVPESLHFRVNGYANAWFINETGTFSIEIYYLPQAWFGLSLKISIVTFILCVFCLVWNWGIRRGVRRFSRHVLNGVRSRGRD